MKITGVTIVRNAILNEYPVKESIESILPVVDEMIVLIDSGEDNSEELIRSINSPKLKIARSKWDLTIREGGRILAEETNKALKLVSRDTDWIFYIQADELVHEKYHEKILESARKYKDDREVDGLLFKYLHFYGTYDYVADSRKWYPCETRIIRNDPSISSYRDAQGFRRNGRKIKVAAIDAWIYHYGWVKSPTAMKKKMKNVSRFWTSDDRELEGYLSTSDIFDFSEFDSIRRYAGTHPEVMKKRIEAQNWKLELDASRKQLKLSEKILLTIEKVTGKRLFAFRNHRIIRK